MAKLVSIVTSYPMDEPVIRNRLEPVVRALLNRGAVVELISPIGGTLDNVSEHSEFHHTQVGYPVDRASGFLLRGLREWKLCGHLLSRICARPRAAVLITIPSMFFLLHRLPRNAGNIGLDFRDLTWEYLSNASWAGKITKWIFRKLVKSAGKKADWFSAVSKVDACYLDALTQRDILTLEIPNGVSSEQHKALENLGIRKSQADRVRVAYVGNVGRAQNLETLIFAAAELPELDFTIAGDGADLDRLKSKASSLGLNNIRFLGRLSWSGIPGVYAESDILYGQLASDYGRAFPSKLYEYLATGKYIIFGGAEEVKTRLGNFENNSVIPPENPKRLVDALREVVARQDYLVNSAFNRKQVGDRYLREVIVDTLVDQLLRPRCKNV